MRKRLRKKLAKRIAMARFKVLTVTGEVLMNHNKSNQGEIIVPGAWVERTEPTKVVIVDADR